MKNLNSLYFSIRIQQLLGQMSVVGTTLVVAPMGYGKTVAVNHFLQAQEQKGNIVMRQSIYGAGREVFWQGVRRTWSNLPLGEALSQQTMPADTNSRALVLELFAKLLPQEECYWFIDDLHLLEDKTASEFIYALSKAGFAKLHLVLASREQIFTQAQRMSLGQQVMLIDKQALAFTREELAEYSRRCGLSISSRLLNSLHEACEGWVSIIYLNFLAYSKYQRLLLDNKSVYEMITSVLLEPLTKTQRELLLLMGQPEEFTPQQIAFVYGNDCTEEICRLLDFNAFIISLANGNLRCHHMLKQATRHAFSLLPQAEQRRYFCQFGKWYVQQQDYEEALDWLYRGQDFTCLLAVVQQLRDWSMREEHKQHLFDWLRECSPTILWQYPQAVLIIMRRMFSLNMIKEMLQVKEWYITALERNTALTTEERNNYYGELEVILSFLSFNSITGMSKHHRKAYQLLSGAPQTLSKQGVWSFGAPSILGLYLKANGGLQQTIDEMYDCMPPYYLLSNWHGAGAAEATEAEALLLQGRLDEMDICLQKAYYLARKHEQECITLCCDFLAMQRDIFNGIANEQIEKYRRHEGHVWKQSVLLNTADMCVGFYYALLGDSQRLPGWLANKENGETIVLYPALPCCNYIKAQCLLSKRCYTELLVRYDDLQAECKPYNNFLCRLYLLVQKAAALAGLGELPKAKAALVNALKLAAADNIILPFAQNITLLKELLDRERGGEHCELVKKILALGRQFAAGREKVIQKGSAGKLLTALSPQELQIAQLAAARHTNKEIAAILNLREGTIKQYLNRIFLKLQIDTKAKNKRHQLSNYFSSTN
ncbi:MAG: LuxR C-terminal-related transcriptional regulator [Phascolarctobacterium sp.]|uniref:LuxR C-terminal-related transcriptional regulator n=1 Tax=Phascolarctobacterium sp. TaxID=2049039 RepID=UPI0026DC4EA1|nr:LuxR C-terminal-related transcriptional regulator [Phascolarctobacterium sp.]MDO4921851.1 LuxR C-terminal-related transcriptional regulator [Phascolarctobacterium sp.]